MEQHRTLKIDGQTVHYRDEGRQNRHTLVLLHGFMANLDVWTSYVLSYMNELRIITIDLPGHGLSDNFSDIHTMDLMADIVHEVLLETGVEECVMVGHSMGGYVSLAFADLFPHMLRGLGLINSHAMADSEQARRHRLDMCDYALENRSGYIIDFIPQLFDSSARDTFQRDISELVTQCLNTTERALCAAQRGMADRPARLDVLQRLDVPTYFVFGKNDPRIPIELAVTHTLMARRPESLLLENVAHMAFLERREYLKPRLLAFVRNCYLNH